MYQADPRSMVNPLTALARPGDRVRAGFMAGIERGRHLVAAAEAFEQDPARPVGSLLVVGDSTAVGAGADEPGQSVAGRLGMRFPGLRIRNVAVEGARLCDVAEQLDSVGRERFDMVLVMAGGNDVLRFTPLMRLRVEATRINAAAMAIARHIAWMPPGNLGAAPLWYWPMSRIIERRSRRVRSALVDVASSMCAIYVDLYRPAAVDPFAVDASRFLAADGMHPSGAGYCYWTAALLERIPVELRRRWRCRALALV